MALSLEGIKSTISSAANVGYEYGSYFCAKTVELGKSFFSTLFATAKQNPKTTAALATVSIVGILGYRNRSTISAIAQKANAVVMNLFSKKETAPEAPEAPKAPEGKE